MKIDFNQFRISRRQLLGSALTLGVASLLPWGKTLQAASANVISANELNKFVALSQVLTGHQALDPAIAQRIWHALQNADGHFVDHANILHEQLAGQSPVAFGQLKDHVSGLPQPLRDAALKIISAWYLGYTGTPVGLTSVDDTQFITFTGALMYQPTLDATVIPTYSRGQTNYWYYPPASIATD